jgi:hypothetical protein
MSKYNPFKKPSKRNKPTRIEDLPPDLRGPAQNKYGGHNKRHISGYRGNTFGPASACKQFTKEEIAEYERKLLKD